MIMITPGLVEPHARTGKLKMIAAATPERLARLPDLPTVAESGYPGFEADQWYGIVAPAGTPREIVGQLETAVRQVLAREDSRGAHYREDFPEVRVRKYPLFPE